MPPQEFTVDNLIAKIKDKSDKVRAEGWLSAAESGGPGHKTPGRRDHLRRQRFGGGSSGEKGLVANRARFRPARG